ncbi:unnamed protein product, partial [marine sediment metagenome]
TAKCMEFSAGRDIDRATIKDASELSKTAIKELGKNKIVFTQDALSDPQFNIKKSVILNQIHSLLCIASGVNPLISLFISLAHLFEKKLASTGISLTLSLNVGTSILKTLMR